VSVAVSVAVCDTVIAAVAVGLCDDVTVFVAVCVTVCVAVPDPVAFGVVLCETEAV